MADAVRTGASSGKAWFLAPLYPWTLAVASGGAPPDMASAERLSVLFGALTAATVAAAARTTHSSLAGWIAGALYAFAGAFVFHDVLPGQEPLLCLLHAAALLLAARFLAGGRPWIAAAVGAVVGVAVLGRSTSAALGAAFVVAVLAHAAPRRRAWLAVLLAAAGAAVVLVPAAARNASATGDFTPLPWSGGPNLYLANGPDSRRDVAFRSSELGAAPDTMERRAAEIAQKSAGRPMTPSEISSWWTRRTFAERGPAAEWTTHVARKAVLFWSAEETPNNHDAAVEREWSVWLRFAPMSAWWLVAAGLAGWWIARRRAPALDVAALTIVITWAALAVFFPLTRYKMPAATVAAVAAAAGTAEILTRRVSWRVAAVAALAMVAAMRASVVAYSPVSHASGMHNIAFAFDHAGMRAEAETYLRRYLAEDPDDGPALEKLGRLLVDDGRPEEGLVLLRRAAQDGRTRWTASAGAVHALVVLGRGIAAELEGVELLAEEPSIPAARAELLADLALAAAATGDASRAEERIRAAEALDAAAPGVVRARAILSR